VATEARTTTRTRSAKAVAPAPALASPTGGLLEETALTGSPDETGSELALIETAPERTERIALLLAEDPGPRRTRSTKAPIPLLPLTAPRPSATEQRRTGQVIVLVPAHNEEDCIEETVASLHRQTTPVDRIVVVCDNCTDRTEELIEPLDCETFLSKDNKQKKAGALNQALVPLFETLNDEDKVLVMDADSILDERFVEEACKLLDEDPLMGAVSASYVGKQIPGFLPVMQRIEYAHGRRRNARRQARVACLSGVACVFTMGALRHLVSERGKSLPGQVDNQVAYLSVSLTEDFEITLALRVLGYKALGPKQCIAYTDLMPTASMLWSQRLRWQRGTLETLRLYGVRKQTWRLYVQQIYTYLMSLASPLMIALWLTSIFALHQGLQVSAWMLVLLPLSFLEQFIATYRMREWKATLLATTIVSMWLFDTFRSIIFWHALVKLLRRTEFAWD
jgi:cellulose synthase/poly-beta-1,6-N-acetylglucosamine synthase-like glycosyltransferase